MILLTTLVLSAAIINGAGAARIDHHRHQNLHQWGGIGGDIGDALDDVEHFAENITGEVGGFISSFKDALNDPLDFFQKIAENFAGSKILVNARQSEANGGFPTSNFMDVFVSEGVLHIAELANTLVTSSRSEEFITSAHNTPMGDDLNFTDYDSFFATMMQHTTLARYLETTDGGETFQVICGPASKSHVVKALFADANFITNLMTIPAHPDGATVSLKLEDGVLSVTGSSPEGSVGDVLGCILEAEEAYHAAYHFIEGNFQYMVNTNQDVQNDPFLNRMLNLQKSQTEILYAGVRWLSVSPEIVWMRKVPSALLAKIVKDALEDYTTLYPFGDLPVDKLSAFSQPIQEIYAMIQETNFGYEATDTISTYVGSDVPNAVASRNNLAKVQMMVGLMHTDTFFWQFAWAPTPHFTKVTNAMVSGLLLYAVSFPDVKKCLSSADGNEQDVSVAYKNVVTDVPDSDQKTALESYLAALNPYREKLSTTGFTAGYSSEQCMSSSTWI